MGLLLPTMGSMKYHGDDNGQVEMIEIDDRRKDAESDWSRDGGEDDRCGASTCVPASK
jgi:hypothetical protein